MTIFQFALKRSFSNKTNLLFLTLFPVLCIFLPEGEGWPFLPYGYQYYGILLLFIGIRLSSILLEDRTKGIVKRLAVAPIRHVHYLSQNLLAFSVIMILQSAIVVVGGVLYGQMLYQPLLLLCLFVSFSFVSLAMALAWIAIFRTKEITFLVYMSIIFLVVILGGLMIPLEIYPEGLKRIAVFFPTYWLERGLDWIVFGGEFREFLLMNGVLWLYAVLFVIVGSMRKING